MTHCSAGCLLLHLQNPKHSALPGGWRCPAAWSPPLGLLAAAAAGCGAALQRAGADSTTAQSENMAHECALDHVFTDLHALSHCLPDRAWVTHRLEMVCVCSTASCLFPRHSCSVLISKAKHAHDLQP